MLIRNRIKGPSFNSICHYREIINCSNLSGREPVTGCYDFFWRS